MWINEVMSNSIDESYGLNFEWISAETGIPEEICGVDKDCIVVPSISDVEQFQDNNEYIEIQVTEEEVVSDDWQVAEEEVVSDDWQVNTNGGDEDMGFVVEGTETGEEQEDYMRLQPYACNLCTLRFNKKSNLSSHMVTHQLEDSLRCNLCGNQYKRKYDLIEHMKVHSYMPGSPSDHLTLPSVPSIRPSKMKKKLSKKKIAKKKSKWQTHLVPLTDPTFDTKPILLINSFFEMNSGSSSSKLKLEDIQIKMDSGEEEEEEDYGLLEDMGEEDKFPIIDPTRPYVCQHCGIGFAREKALISHNMIHAGDSAFECAHCHDMFSSEQLLDTHITNRHPRIKAVAKKKKTPVKKSGFQADKFKTFQCDRCEASFSRYNQLKRHQRGVHTKADDTVTIKQEEVFVCDLCNQAFDTEEAVALHREIHVTTDELHSCNTCGEGYTDISELHSHMKSKHKWGHFCHLCGTAYRDAKSLTKHLLTHADSTQFFPCPVCHRLFFNRGKLKKHTDVAHAGRDGYKCGDCGELFCDGPNLASHRQARHNVGRLFPCTQCGKTFTSRSSQQIHIRVHTGEKPYGCRFCWKAFADGGTLRKHERIHTGEKPYVCPVCTKAFNQRVVLREHVRAHHSEGRGRSFECTVCGETLAQSVELVAHLVMHSDENTAKHRLPNTSTRKYSRRKESTSCRTTSRSSSSSTKHHHQQYQYTDDAPLSPCK